MLRSLMICRWIHLCLALVLVGFIAAACPFPSKNLRYGTVQFQKPEDVNNAVAPHNYLVRFSCLPGYTLMGSRYIICSYDKWSDVFPECIIRTQGIPCSQPPEIENSIFELDTGVNELATIGSTVLYSCKNGYELLNKNASTLTCVLGQNADKFSWVGEMPVCKEKECSPPPKVENSTSKFHTGVNQLATVGSTVAYSCKNGSELLNETASTLTCVLSQKDNKVSWEGEMPVCKVKTTCSDPGQSPDGTREGNCCSPGDSLKFSCNKSYELVGPEEITCLPTGSWTSRRPLCRPLGDHCPIYPKIPHGSVNGSKIGDYYRPYDEVKILCEPGYSHIGKSPYIMCENTSQWEMDFGKCEEFFCNLPAPLANGTILELQLTNLTSFPYNFELTYICDKGFRLIGGGSWRFCDSAGWTGKTPRCEVIRCPDPGVPEHGSRGIDDFGVGSKVYFKCSTGYKLIGSFERYCKPNGQWTGELARCDTKTNYCPDPGIPINGNKNSTDYDMGNLVGFECSPGYIRLGSEARVCLPNRTWSGVETTCLGPYDFDNSAQVRDNLKMAVRKKQEEHRKMFFHGYSINIHYPGRLILYFAFDMSSSVGQQNFDKSIKFAKAIVRKVRVTNNGARAGALTFSSKSEIQFLPLDYNTTEDVLHALDKLNYTGGGTSASSALTQIREELIPLTEHRLGKKNQKSIVFVLTDGKANMGGNPQVEANILKEAGVEIYCIGITGDIKKQTLYEIASDSTEEPHVFILENYPTLAWLVQEITNETIDYSQCGLGMEDAGKRKPTGLILNGKKVIKSWPWIAAIFILPPEMDDLDRAELQCGGSIIDKKFILTAAHCLYYEIGNDWHLRRVSEILVKLGLTHVKNETFAQTPEVEIFYIHPKYKPGINFDYDIALLQLKTTIEFKPHIRPICLPPKDSLPNSKFYRENELGLVAGWGHEFVLTEFSQIDATPSEHLKELIIPIQSKERCIKSLKEKYLMPVFTDQMFCAGDGYDGNDTCRGDSGGPFMQSQLNNEGYVYWTQVGIVSWGVGCGLPNSYGFYSHVQILRKWIDETIEKSMKEEF